MSGPAQQVYHIARRDFMQRAKSRVFLLTMLVIVGLVLSLGPFVALEFRDPPPYRVGVIGEIRPELVPALAMSADAFDRAIEVETYPEIGGAEAALADGSLDVLLVDGRELVWAEEENLQLVAIVNTAVGELTRRRAMSELGLTRDEAAPLIAPPPLASASLQEPDPEEVPRRVGANVGVFLLYMSILIFGQFVLLGVMEEKSSRVVEVILSRVRPHQIVAGKVLGIGLLGLLQLVVVGAAIVFVLGMIELPDVEPASIGVDILVPVVLWFLLGYAFFSVIYAALGATVSRQEDAQGVVLLPAMLIIPGLFIGIFALENPDTALVQITSLVPPTSPIVMPMRLSVTSVPMWEVGLAVSVIVAATYGLIRLGGRVYSGAILRIGAKVRLRDAWRAAAR